MEPSPSLLDTISLSVSPASVLQGEIALVNIDGSTNSAALTGLTLGGEPLTMFPTQNGLAAFVGVNLHKEPGIYPIILYLADGRVLKENA
ncbi:MAG: hypothetical protein WDN67_01240 [Candidatus Moraniibacteriota bacterium]